MGSRIVPARYARLDPASVGCLERPPRCQGTAAVERYLLRNCCVCLSASMYVYTRSTCFACGALNPTQTVKQRSSISTSPASPPTNRINAPKNQRFNEPDEFASALQNRLKRTHHHCHCPTNDPLPPTRVLNSRNPTTCSSCH